MPRLQGLHSRSRPPPSLLHFCGRVLDIMCFPKAWANSRPLLGTATLPHNHLELFMRWLVARLDSTRCLRFIDPYGDTVFNRLQIPVLQSECSELRFQLTEQSLLEAKQAYLKNAEVWPKAAQDDAGKTMETLTLGKLQNHLKILSDLLADAAAREPLHYVRFMGD